MRTLILSIALSSVISSGMYSFAGGIPEREIVYVDNKTGSDDFDGHASQPGNNKAGPFETIMKAVKSCKIGARIEIANTGQDYRERVIVEGPGEKGHADMPLVINGNGAYVTGLVVVPANAWIHLRDDIYYFLGQLPEGMFVNGNQNIARMPTNIWLNCLKHQGYFNEKEAPKIFFVDGKPGSNALSLEKLEPGGFFYDTQATTLKEPAGKRAIFFRLPAKKRLEQCSIELPLNNGICIDRDYVVVENIGSRYSNEDGFDGAWGQGIVFRNIRATNNTEQGMSFHFTGSALIDGAVLEGNGGCGIVDVHASHTIYRNVTVRNNYPEGAILSGLATSMIGCRIYDNAGAQVKASLGCGLLLKHCLIAGRGSKSPSGVELGAGQIEHCTIVNCGTGIDASVGVRISDSIISNCTRNLKIPSLVLPAGYRFEITNTLLGVGEIMFDGKKLDSAGIEDFKNRYPTVMFDSFTFEDPQFTLPKDSPYLKAGTKGSILGASLPVFKE